MQIIDLLVNVSAFVLLMLIPKSDFGSAVKL